MKPEGQTLTSPNSDTLPTGTTVVEKAVTSTPHPVVNEVYKPRSKVPLIILIILLVFILFCLAFIKFTLRGSKLFSSTKQKVVQSILIFSRINPFLVKTYDKNSTAYMVYIQDHNLLFTPTDKYNPETIATHVPTNFTYKHYLSGKDIESSWDDYFIIEPCMSGDGKYIIYEKISDKSLNDLEIWKNLVATESAEIKNSGDSVAYNQPTRSYNTVLYNVTDKTTEIIDNQIGTSEKDYVELFPWAKNTNILPIHTTIRKNTGIAFIYETRNEGFKLISLENLLKKQLSDTFNSTENSWDTPFGPSLSPDGTQLTANYQFNNPAAGCNNTWGYKTYYINLLTNTLNKLLLTPSTICKAQNIGWIGNDKFITLELLPGSKFQISVWSNNASVQENLMNYDGYPSHVSISPNGKWLTYLREDPQTKKTEYVFLNLSTKEAFNLFYFMGENGIKDIDYSDIFTPKWSRDSSTAYIKAKRKDNQTYDIVSYNADKKEYKVPIENISDFDIN